VLRPPAIRTVQLLGTSGLPGAGGGAGVPAWHPRRSAGGGRQQGDGTGLVVVVFERVLDGGVAAAVGIVDAVLAAAGDEAGVALARFQRADERAGDLFLAEVLASSVRRPLFTRILTSRRKPAAWPAAAS